MKKKILLIVGGVLLVALVVGGALAYFMMRAPYQPGMVRAADDLRDPLTPPAQKAAGAYWQVTRDVRLYHQDRGSGEDVLVIHGGPGVPPARTWKGLDRLASSYRFRYYHQRGCGRSTRPIKQLAGENFYENMKTMVSTLGLQAQVADIERIRRIMGAGKLILVGHSFGGFLAALYAAEFPRRVKALVLVAPANLVKFPMEPGGEPAGDHPQQAAG